MSSSNTSPEHMRANLILLRVWRDDIDEDRNEHEHGNTSISPSRRWHGKVQRTVSGEEHSFGAKEELIEVLEAMIYKDRTVHSRHRPRGKASSELTLPEGGNTRDVLW